MSLSHLETKSSFVPSLFLDRDLHFLPYFSLLAHGSIHKHFVCSIRVKKIIFIRYTLSEIIPLRAYYIVSISKSKYLRTGIILLPYILQKSELTNLPLLRKSGLGYNINRLGIYVYFQVEN